MQCKSNNEGCALKLSDIIVALLCMLCGGSVVCVCFTQKGYWESIKKVEKGRGPLLCIVVEERLT